MFDVPRSDRVDHLLVLVPDFVPLHVDVTLPEPLVEHELPQRVHLHPAAHDALHRGEARIEPPRDPALVDEPLELALAHDRADEVHARECDHLDRAEVEETDDPLILGVARVVPNWCGSTCMSV